MCVGSILSSIGAAQANRSMNNTIDDALQRQRGFQSQANQAVLGSIGQSGTDVANAEIAKGTGQTLEGYKNIRDVPLSVENDTGVKMGSGAPASQAWADLMGAQRAPLTGYNEFTLQQQIKNLRAAEQLGIISQLARLQAGVTPVALQSASQAGADLQGWGGILSSIGGSSGGQAAALGFL